MHVSNRKFLHSMLMDEMMVVMKMMMQLELSVGGGVVPAGHFS